MDRNCLATALFDGTLQMFTGIYKCFIGKSGCRDFKFMGIVGNMYNFGIIFAEISGYK